MIIKVAKYIHISELESCCNSIVKSGGDIVSVASIDEPKRERFVVVYKIFEKEQ